LEQLPHFSSKTAQKSDEFLKTIQVITSIRENHAHQRFNELQNVFREQHRAALVYDMRSLSPMTIDQGNARACIVFASAMT
jgi:hypothetical protein